MDHHYRVIEPKKPEHVFVLIFYAHLEKGFLDISRNCDGIRTKSDKHIEKMRDVIRSGLEAIIQREFL